MNIIKRTVPVASIQIGKTSEIDIDSLMGSVMTDRAFRVAGKWSVLSKAPKENKFGIRYEIEDVSMYDKYPKFRIEWECLRPGRYSSINAGAPDIVFLLMSCQDLLGREHDVLSDLDGAASTLNGIRGCPFVRYEFLDASGTSKDEREEIMSIFCSAENPGSAGVGCKFFGHGEEIILVEDMLSACADPIYGKMPGTSAYRQMMQSIVGRREPAPGHSSKHLFHPPFWLRAYELFCDPCISMCYNISVSGIARVHSRTTTASSLCRNACRCPHRDAPVPDDHIKDPNYETAVRPDLARASAALTSDRENAAE